MGLEVGGWDILDTTCLQPPSPYPQHKEMRSVFPRELRCCRANRRERGGMGKGKGTRLKGSRRHSGHDTLLHQLLWETAPSSNLCSFCLLAKQLLQWNSCSPELSGNYLLELMHII